MTPRKNGFVPLSAGRLVPRSSPNQILLSLAFRGPSQILSIASASAGVRQVRICRRAGRPADVRRGAELARPRIVDHPVGHPVGGVARRYGRRGRLIQLGRGDRPADEVLHDDLAPHLRRLEAGPVDRRRVRQNAVELAGELLGEQIALAPAGRAAVPVVVGRLLRVVRPRDRLREKDLRLDRIADEVLDELEVVGAVQVDTGLAVEVGSPMAGVGARADVAGIHRPGNGQVARAPAATDALGPAVPCAFHPASPPIGGVEREADADVDVLIRVGAVEQVDLAVGQVRPACRDDLAGRRLHDRIPRQARGEIGARHGRGRRLVSISRGARRRDERGKHEYRTGCKKHRRTSVSHETPP